MKKHSVKNPETKLFASFAESAAQTEELWFNWKTAVYAVFRKKQLVHTYPEPSDHSIRIGAWAQWPKDSTPPPLSMDLLGIIVDLSKDSADVNYGMVDLWQSKILPHFLIKAFEADRYRKMINKLISLSNCDKHILQFSELRNNNGVEICRMAKVFPLAGNEQKPHHLVIQTQDDITTAAYSIPLGLLSSNSRYEYVLAEIKTSLLAPHVLQKYAAELGFALHVYLTSGGHHYNKMLEIMDKHKLPNDFTQHCDKYIFLDHNGFFRKVKELQTELHTSSALAPAVKDIELLF